MAAGLDTDSLSARTVTTKYGSLRGTIVYFKTYDRSFGSSVKSSTASSPGQAQAKGAGPAAGPPLKPVEVFQGVPYATPPIGSLRFMPPVTPTHWRGVRLATRFGPVCPQRLPDTVFRGKMDAKGSAGGSRSSSSSSSSMASLSTHIKAGSLPFSFSGPSGSASTSSSANSANQLPDSRLAYLKRMIPFLKNQSEDCLYLNIYVPYTQGSATSGAPQRPSSYPVAVYIHGDSYDWGSGNSYDGTILSSFGNVIVVTLNYRLGIFGFLPAQVDGSSRGNYGLMDIVAALHWIQENIGEFGGDALNVTLIGHGHGAALVNLLMISPMASSALFSRVVLMSGSALSPWAIARDADTYARHLGKALNCPNYDNGLMVDCIRSKKVDDILDIDLKVPEHLSSFGPIVDGIVVPSEPRQLSLNVHDAEANPAHFMASGTGHHSSANLMDRQAVGAVNGAGVPYDLLFGITRVEAPPVFTALEEKSGIDLQRRDRILRTLVRNLFDYHQQNDGSNSNQRIGCQHGEELHYAFGAPLAQDLLGNQVGHFASNYSKQEITLSEAVMTYWTNFVKFGDPNIWPHELDSLGDRAKGRFENVFWPQYDTVQRKYLMIGMKPKVRDHYHSHRLSYWLHLVPRLQQQSDSEEQMYYRKHHLLPDHENLDTYDGIVRQISFRFMSPSLLATNNGTGSGLGQSAGFGKQHGGPGGHGRNRMSDNDASQLSQGGGKLGSPMSTAADQSKRNPVTNGSHHNPNGNPGHGVTTASSLDTNGGTLVANKTQATPIVMEQSSYYSTALGVTIAVGCSLLILNMLIFAGMYYQLSKSKNSNNPANNNLTSSYSPPPPLACSFPREPRAAMATNNGHNQHQHHHHLLLQQQQHHDLVEDHSHHHDQQLMSHIAQYGHYNDVVILSSVPLDPDHSE
ncbi:Neuroligin-3 [Halotydeus destructor]|nr:Neuroligin-3 [Halotydeus destructor]